MLIDHLFSMPLSQLIIFPTYTYKKKTERGVCCSPSRFSASHLEFLGLMWLSHHQECEFFDSNLFILLFDWTWHVSKDMLFRYFDAKTRYSRDKQDPNRRINHSTQSLVMLEISGPNLIKNWQVPPSYSPTKLIFF